MLAYAFIAGGYLVTIMSFAMIYAVFIIGLNVFMGFAGQVSFGHNAFAALSGYASAVLTATYYWDPIAAFVVGLGLALLVALVVGWPTLRLKGHYLAMATLAIGLIVYEIAIQWQSVTQGYMGISGISPLGIGGLRGRVRPRQAFHAHDHRGPVELGCSAPACVALRQGARRHRWKRRCGPRARHRCRALQARRVPGLRRLCGARGLAIRACGRVRQPRSVWSQHGRGGIHDALCRRHWHTGRADSWRGDREPAAGDIPGLQGLSGFILRRGSDPAADLRAERPRRAWQLSSRAGERHDAPCLCKA